MSKLPGFERKRRKTKRLYEKQKGICWICGLPMLFITDKTNIQNYETESLIATIDHLAHKGEFERNRKVKAAHRYCNMARHHYKTIREYQMQKIRELVEQKQLSQDFW